MANHLNDDDLIALAAGDLPLSGHLVDCSQCASRLREFERTLELTRLAPAQAEWNSLLSSGFLHRVRRGIERDEANRGPQLLGAHWWRPALAGGAVALLLMMAVQFTREESTIVLQQSSTAEEQALSLSAMADRAADLVPAETGLLETETELFEIESVATGMATGDDEFLTLINAYLIDTASEDELMLTLGDFERDVVVAVVDL
jgi:hypothetical protein